MLNFAGLCNCYLKYTNKTFTYVDCLVFLIIRVKFKNFISESESSSLYQALLEANLATEVGLTALDSLGLYCLHFKDVLMTDDGDNPIMKAVFDLYLSFLQVGQSETLFRHVFASFRAFINNFSLALFQGNLNFYYF